MIISNSTLDALRTSFSKSFETAYSSATPKWPALATEVPSSTRTNTYGWIAQQMKLREWVGPRQAYNLAEHKWAIENKSFEGTIDVDRDDIEDDNIGMYTNLAIPQLAEATAKHPDQLLVALIQANPLGFDGKALFAADHPVYDKAGSVYDNDFGSTALSADNLNTVWAAMSAYKGEDGEPLGVSPDLLIIPPQLWKTAKEILEAEYTTSGASNVMRGLTKILVMEKLANAATTWYLADTSKPIKPFVWQKRRAPKFDSKTNPETSDLVFNQKTYRYGVEYRGAVGHTLPFLIGKAVA